LAQPSRWQQFLDYGREGVWHIWIGFDHILFLLSLLLPAVLRRTNGRWEPVEAFSPAFWNVFGIVTAFTVAHSITLSLATLGAVVPVAFLLRGTAFYRQVVFFGGSALIVLVAGIWVVERSLDVQLAIFAAATRPTVGSYDNMRDMLVIASAVRTAKSSFRGSP